MLLSVRVTPKSSQNKATGLHLAADGTMSLAVKVTAPPDKGKANKAVIAVIADVAGLPISALSIASGETGRHKSLLVTGNTSKLEALIASFISILHTGNRNGEDH